MAAGWNYLFWPDTQAREALEYVGIDPAVMPEAEFGPMSQSGPPGTTQTWQQLKLPMEKHLPREFGYGEHRAIHLQGR